MSEVELEVDVVRSPRRRRTVQAQVVEGRLRISIPARMSREEEAHWVDVMRRRFARQRACDDVDLDERVATLARRHRLPVPASIRWVDNQQARWGSCTPSDGAIRVSSRLASFPGWVLDYVIVHELAHLVEPGHGAAFQRLVARYPRAERAEGFLIAVGLGHSRRERPALSGMDAPSSPGWPAALPLPGF